MSFDALLKDRCLIQNRVVDDSGMVDEETWVDQPEPTRCRAITTTTKRRTSPESAEKVQYGTFVFMTFHLPRNAEIEMHDRIMYPADGGKVFDVIAISHAGGRSTHHIVAQCDGRA